MGVASERGSVCRSEWGRELSGKIYLFGEAPLGGTLKTEIASVNSAKGAKAIDVSQQKIQQNITMLRTMVDKKHAKKIFVEDGSVLVKPIMLNFPDVNVEVLHVDPQVQRFVRVTRQEIADSIALKERLMSEFASIREEPLKSEGSDEISAEQERYAHVLEERMKGLTPAEELFRKLDEATAHLEVGWVDQIYYGFIDPSLVVCGRIRIYPSKEDVMASGKSGRLPELLKERGYDVEVAFVESEEQQE